MIPKMWTCIGCGKPCHGLYFYDDRTGQLSYTVSDCCRQPMRPRPLT